MNMFWAHYKLKPSPVQSMLTKCSRSMLNYKQLNSQANGTFAVFVFDIAQKQFQQQVQNAVWPIKMNKCCVMPICKESPFLFNIAVFIILISVIFFYKSMFLKNLYIKSENAPSKIKREMNQSLK